MSRAGEKFILPGGKLVMESKEEETTEIELPPISGELSEWGPLTRTLAETIAELQTPGRSEVFTPRALLNEVISKLPQFGGGDQHDSHELLRHLLEAVRSEDLRRYRSVILKSLGLSSKTDPATVDGERKQKVKFYGQQASDTMLRPEQVFRGFMVSTLECQECLHTSERPEYFLDLSLPVVANRPQPPAVARRKTPSIDENLYGSTSQDDHKPSKHQLKKEQRAAKKAARKNKSGKLLSANGKIEEKTLNGEVASGEQKDSSSEQSDADVEDNVEDNSKHAESNVASSSQTTAEYFDFSAYNFSEKICTSPVELDKEKADTTPENPDKDILRSDIFNRKTLNSLENLSNPDSGVASPDATKNNSTETVDNVDSLITRKDLGSQSSLSSELNLDLNGSANKLSPVKMDYDRPVSRISFVPEAKNELMLRGISVEGSSNLLKYGKRCARKSYENLATADPIKNIDYDLDMMKLWTDEPLNGKLDFKKPLAPCPSYADDMALGGGLDTVKSNHELESSSTILDAESIKRVRKLRSAPYSSGYAAPSTLTVSNNLELDAPLGRDYVPSFSYRPSSLTSPRYQNEEGECSIQSCLNQFTALELMTGNNKVSCEACTERINGKNGKTVYTNATKQFLVSSPPAVLILHLKRFQLGPRCMFRKMAKHVDFPTVLDLAPYCQMKKVRNLPNVNRNQTELLYSLYGIVEHSGGMHGGHYVAYVKVRPPVKAGDPRYSFLPTGGNIAKDCGDSSKEGSRTEGESDSSLSGYESEESPAVSVEPPPGRWYYVSDSLVCEVPEEKVLRSQAYLLFYERIL